ncbi:MAG: hypothetical protein CVU89_08200 [Firmicutes bacterium HGW-Firmicutes-14]|nr:MAG: hypothetical protein CVU89_08200 [Firmicutes bacterium HGW-Firmicutes-14]
MAVILLVLKFTLIAIIYFFILKVFRIALADLKRVSKRKGDRSAEGIPVSGAELVVTGSTDPAIRQGEVFRLKKLTGIGRNRDNTVNIQDSFVSHDHARIIFKEGSYILEDLDSVNGTFINGARIKDPVTLEHGDAVRIAGVTFKFVRWEYEVE